jgi:WD40 repeat protein
VSLTYLQNGKEKDPADIAPSSLIPGVKGTSIASTAQAGTANGTVKRKAAAAAVAEGEKRRRTPPASPPTTGAAVANGAKDIVMADAKPFVEPKYPIKRLTDSDTMPLEGHVDIVDHCHWHPSNRNCLLTGSADGTVRIWQLSIKQGEKATSTTLSCLPSRTTDKSVTAIAWNASSLDVRDCC